MVHCETFDDLTYKFNREESEQERDILQIALNRHMKRCLACKENWK